MEPKFSIIVPVYKAEASLSRCLDSILGSTLTEIEVICVNDASPDKCSFILERYIKKDSRVKVITFKENRGVAAARNAGLDAAKGIYIGFVDSDDSIDEYHLEDIYKTMQKERSEINLVSFKFIKPDKVIYFPDLTKFVAKFGSATQKMDGVDKLTMLDDYCWRLAIRRSFWEKYKIYFPEGIKGSEDQCFWKPLELKATRVSFMENYGYNYYWSSVSLTKQEMSSFETVRGIDELMKRLPVEYHLPLMEKCCKRIHDFVMKNDMLKNKLKRDYIKRVYAKAKECGLKEYELDEYNYRNGIYSVKKTHNEKTLKIFGITVYRALYNKERKVNYFLGLKLFSKRIEPYGG
ncbi:glycosyltransferase family 2 protein [Mailhella massiliensis]|uniref:glycosyltransferase family 2 protein n=1 Tax=Mailhella massiliensis TaxID=1903261 RepID=UPI0023572E48|nr:glycosyltransferase family 2 protein [Mailhella massiliensis]